MSKELCKKGIWALVLLMLLTVCLMACAKKQENTQGLGQQVQIDEEVTEESHIIKDEEDVEQKNVISFEEEPSENNGEEEILSQHTQPSEMGTEPFQEETQPSAQETQPSAQETQPPAQETQPPAQETQPPAQETQPPAQETQPPAEEPVTEPDPSGKFGEFF